MQHEDIASYSCPTCGFELWLPLGALRVSTLGFYDDARFPGRCLLALNTHYEDLADVETDTLNLFMADVQQAARAVETATGADRMNYAVLGNTEPHVHFHLIPRIRSQDPVPTRPPWEHPESTSPLPPGRARDLAAAIKRAL